MRRPGGTSQDAEMFRAGAFHEDTYTDDLRPSSAPATLAEVLSPQTARDVAMRAAYNRAHAMLVRESPRMNPNERMARALRIALVQFTEHETYALRAKLNVWPPPGRAAGQRVTDSDIAEALGVTPKTVQRDRADWLRAQRLASLRVAETGPIPHEAWAGFDAARWRREMLWTDEKVA